MSTNEQEITLLFPQGKSIVIKGETIALKPFGFGKFPKVLKVIKSLKTEGRPALRSAEEAAAAIGSLDIVSLIADNSDAVVELCALALNKPVTYFDDVPPDEAVDLVQAIIEVNADFFVKRLQPKLLTALSGLSASVGGMLSQVSSPTGTA